MNSTTNSLRRTALLAGASGLTGSYSLNYLVNNELYKRVTVLVRNELMLTHPRLDQQLISFDDLFVHHDLFAVDDVFCCLGTTIRKAGSQEAFRHVDYDLPLTMAQIAAEKNVSTFSLMSSLGANAKSGVFYNRVKGELEQALQALPLNKLAIYRPSLLLGNRAEFRFGERLAEMISKPLSLLFFGPLKKYRPIEAKVVAAVMVNQAAKLTEKVNIFESDGMQDLYNIIQKKKRA